MQNKMVKDGGERERGKLLIIKCQEKQKVQPSPTSNPRLLTVKSGVGHLEAQAVSQIRQLSSALPPVLGGKK